MKIDFFNKPKNENIYSDLVKKSKGHIVLNLSCILLFGSTLFDFFKAFLAGEEDLFTVITTAFLTCIPLWRLYIWLMRLKMAQLFDCYYDAVRKSKDNNIKKIAFKLGEKEDKVAKNYFRLSKMELLPSLVISNDGEICFLQRNSHPLGSKLLNSEEKVEQVSSEMVAFFCPFCGANNQGLKGKTLICEYCGSAIEKK